MRDAESRFAESAQSAGASRFLQSGLCADPSLARAYRGGGAPSPRRSVRAAAAAAAIAVGMLAVSVSPASAVDNGHAFSFSFKPTGTSEFGNSIPSIDTDNSAGPSSGYIYVGDAQRRRIQKFDTAGNFVLMFGDNVNATTTGDVCTAASGNTCKTGLSGTGPEKVFPRFIAVDQSSGPSKGDIYVGDTSQRTVHKYDENGNLITSYGTGGQINGSAAEGGPFVFMLGIDVDSAGNLLVSNEVSGSSTEETRVFKFAQDGTPLGSFTTAANNPGDTEEGFAWAPGYVFRKRSQWLRRAKDTDGSGLVTISKNPYTPCVVCFYPRNIGADPSTGTAYEMMENFSGGLPRVWEFKFNGSGQPLDSAGSPCAVTLTVTGDGCPPTHEFGSDVLTQNSGVGGIGINAASNKIYVTEPATRSVKVFVGVPQAIAVTGEPTAKKTVSGTAKPDGAGEITECKFEFGTTTSYGSTEACSPGGSYPGEQAVTAVLPITSETLYHYRLMVKNAAGAVSFGADKTILPHNVDGLETLAAENVTRNEAKMKGTFKGDGTETKYYFEWGTTTSYLDGKSAVPPGPNVGEPSYPPATPLEFAATGLSPETEYHYRVVAENTSGKTLGNDKTFKTLPAVQSVTTEPAELVGRKFATLKGSFNGDASHTTWKFEWGTTVSYGNSTTIGDAGSPSGFTQEPFKLEGLALETVYHYRFTATNPLGTTKGNDQQFKTLPAVPGLATKPATEISQDGVTLNGQYSGNGENTHYYYEYGLTTKYGHTTADTDANAPSVTTSIPTVITDFEAYATYHYRVVATNAEGKTVGQDLTFTTLPAPLPTISGTTASEVSPTGVMFEAEINPNRWATVYLFEYGNSQSYGDFTEISQPIGSDQFAHPVSEKVAGLLPGTSYHFRAVAINFTGTQYGADQVVTTPDAPRIDLNSSSGVGQTTAHLSANVSPNLSLTTVRFEYGTTSRYGSSTADTAIGSDTAAHQVGTDLTGLVPGTTYHFRVVATNVFGVTEGPDQIFSTSPATPPKEEEPPKKTCKKRFVLRHGKCVRKKHRKHHRHSTRRDG